MWIIDKFREIKGAVESWFDQMLRLIGQLEENHVGQSCSDIGRRPIGVDPEKGEILIVDGIYSRPSYSRCYWFYVTLIALNFDPYGYQNCFYDLDCKSCSRTLALWFIYRYKFSNIFLYFVFPIISPSSLQISIINHFIYYCLISENTEKPSCNTSNWLWINSSETRGRQLSTKID